MCKQLAIYLGKLCPPCNLSPMHILGQIQYDWLFTFLNQRQSRNYVYEIIDYIAIVNSGAFIRLRLDYQCSFRCSHCWCACCCACSEVALCVCVCVSGLCHSVEGFLCWSTSTCLAASSSLRWGCRSWCQHVLPSTMSTSITATTSTVTQVKLGGVPFSSITKMYPH